MRRAHIIALPALDCAAHHERRRERAGGDVLIGAAAAALVLLLSVAYVSAHLGFVHKAKRVPETDHLRYIEMARGRTGTRPELAREDPFCFRVLVPGAARALTAIGLGENAAFYLLTNACLFGFLVATFLFLRGIGFARAPALLGLVLVGLTPGAVRWYEYQYWMTDPAALFLLVLALGLIHRDEPRALAIVTTVAALVRETGVVVFVYYFVRLWRTRSGTEAVRQTAAVAVGPVLVLGLLHLFVRPVAPSPLGAVLEDALSFRARHFFDNQLYLLTAGSWGVVLPVLLLFPGRLAAAVRRRPEGAAFVLAVYVSLVVANNTERLLAYALPVALPVALEMLDRFATRAAVPWAAVAAVTVAAQSFFWWRTRLFDAGMSLYQPTDLAVAAVLAASWLGARILLARRGSVPTSA